eukprot:533101_1
MLDMISENENIYFDQQFIPCFMVECENDKLKKRIESILCCVDNALYPISPNFDCINDFDSNFENYNYDEINKNDIPNSPLPPENGLKNDESNIITLVENETQLPFNQSHTSEESKTYENQTLSADASIFISSAAPQQSIIPVLPTIQFSHITDGSKINDQFDDFSAFLQPVHGYNAFDQRLPQKFDIKQYKNNPNDDSGIIQRLATNNIKIDGGLDITTVIQTTQNKINSDLQQQYRPNDNDNSQNTNNTNNISSKIPEWMNDIKLIKILEYQDNDQCLIYELYLQYRCQKCGFINCIHDYVREHQPALSIYCNTCTADGMINNPIYTSNLFRKWAEEHDDFQLKMDLDSISSAHSADDHKTENDNPNDDNQVALPQRMKKGSKSISSQ